MSNQIIISSGAKVRSLEGVLTGTAGIVNSVPLGGANGVATLDSNGKVPLSQLPASVVTYLGTWNAATNTPTLANGTGDVGDLYICNVAGTVNFGAGPITFAVGDWVIYNGSQWQKSAGQNGTVTSVAVTESGDALTITGSPITTAGTINIGFAGTGSQYIKGDGTLATFPTTIAQANRLVTEVYNSTGATLTKGTVVYINGGQGNLPTVTKAQADSEVNSFQTYGLVQSDITNNNNGYVVVAGALTDLNTNGFTDGTTLYLSPTTAGAYTSTKPTSPNHIIYVGVVVRAHATQGVIEVKIQNTQELSESSDVLITSPANNDGLFYESSTSLWKNKTIANVLGYTPANAASVVPYSGATSNVNLGSYNLTTTGSITAGDVNSGFLIAETAAAGAGYLFLKGNGSFGALSLYNSIFADGYKYGFDAQGGTSGAAKRAYLDFGSLTNNTTRTYAFPNTSGTVALTSDIPSLTGYVPYTGATSSVVLGTNNSLTAHSLFTTATAEGGLFLTQNSAITGSESSTTYSSIKAFTNRYLLFSFGQPTALKRFRFDVNGLTDNTTLTYIMPNANGTIALTSDIPSLTNYVTLNGTQTITGIKTFTNEQLFGNGMTLTGGYITYTSGSFNLTLNTNLLTANRNVFLQDAAGTIALLSDIPSLTGYVQTTRTISTTAPLSGGGDLSANRTLSISQANSTTNGFLSSTDWNTFNNKQNALTNPVTGTGTTSYLPKFTGTSTIGNSAVYDGGSGVNVIGTGTVLRVGELSGTTGKQLLFSIDAADGHSEIASIWQGTSATSLCLNPSGGNVGIGNTSPSYKLDVTGTGRFTGTLYAANSTTTGSSTLFQISKASGYGTINFNLSYDSTYFANGKNLTLLNEAGYAAAIFAWNNAGTQSNLLVPSGNVGIGTNSPSYKLDVNATGYGIQHYADASNYLRTYCGSTYQIIESNGTNQFGYVGGNFFVQTSATERMRITSGGELLIGTTTTGSKLVVSQSANAPALQLNSPNGITVPIAQFSSVTSASTSWYALVTQSGNGSSITTNTLFIYGNGNVVNTNGSYGTMSDISLKENIIDTTPKLDDILKLKVRNFNLIKDENKAKQIGFIAQELEEVFPSMIEIDGQTNLKSIKTSVLVPMLVKAIQELSAKVSALENKS